MRRPNQHGSIIFLRVRQMRVSRQGVLRSASRLEFFRPNDPLPRLQRALRCRDSLEDSRRNAATKAMEWVAPSENGPSPAAAGGRSRISCRPQPVALSRRPPFQMASFQAAVSDLLLSQCRGMERTRQMSSVWSGAGEERAAVSHLGLKSRSLVAELLRCCQSGAGIFCAVAGFGGRGKVTDATDGRRL